MNDNDNDNDNEKERSRDQLLNEIAERKRVEEALQDSEEKYRILVENSRQGIMVLQDGRLQFANPRVVQHSGYSLTELMSRPFLELVHPEDRVMVAERYEKRLKGEATPEVYEFRFIDKQNQVQWVEVNSVRITWNGRPATLSFLSDINERKRTEQTLRESESKYRSLVNQSLHGIVISQGVPPRFVFANPAMAEILGYSREELMSLPAEKTRDLVHPDDLVVFFQRYQERLEGGNPPPSYVVRAVRKDGTVRWTEMVSNRIEYNGEPAVQAVFQDITERKKAEVDRIQNYENLTRVMNQTINALVRTLGKRDPYTSTHQQRVTRLACAIAKEMGQPSDQIECIRVAGTLHDIGKIYVPAEILSKPTSLTKAEFEIIKTHAQGGSEILQEIDFPWPIAKIISQHHEKMDGSGYPSGLKGEDILLEARILTVADVVEAMSSHRPYRPALGIEAALDDITKNKRILYDPAVVDACLNLFRDRGYIFDQI
jgi:PAS domain S-box-containing protein/putative nucleotidyltransferase with HDIG domain